MFRKLPPLPKLAPDVLRALADSMREPDAAATGWGGPTTPPADVDNPAIPAGYTYFGQFLDHDITFDPASSLDQANDPNALHDFRTPRFDLDSVYGSGPADEPFQYDKASPGKLLVGDSQSQPDLPRNSQGIALIGDPRNDENIIVSGLQTAFLLLHNKLLDEVTADPNVPEANRFDEAQRRVRWHYQWIIVHDFLPRLVGTELLERLMKFKNGKIDFDLPNYRPRINAFMPVEFSVAAYRFGHSQVRPAYDLNSSVTNRPIFAPGDAVGELDDLRGRRALPAGWKIDWSLFFPINGSTPQPSRRIDTHLAAGLFDLPDRPADSPQSLAELNLLRGQAFDLPSGQDVAKYLGQVPRTGADLGGAPEPTPLWFYILKEAELEGGERLGPVGGQIVAEVLLGLLKLDPKAWVNVDPAWKPTIPASGESLTLGDVVKFATT